MTKQQIIDAAHAWIVPPACQGQMVEVAYADGYNGYGYRRVIDRSDADPAGEATYSWCDFSSCGCEEECDCWSPANVEPTAYDWTPASDA